MVRVSSRPWPRSWPVCAILVSSQGRASIASNRDGWFSLTVNSNRLSYPPDDRAVSRWVCIASARMTAPARSTSRTASERGDLVALGIHLLLGDHRGPGAGDRGQEVRGGAAGLPGATGGLAVHRDHRLLAAGRLLAAVPGLGQQPRADLRIQHVRVHLVQGPADRGLARHHQAPAARVPPHSESRQHQHQAPPRPIPRSPSATSPPPRPPRTPAPGSPPAGGGAPGPAAGPAPRPRKTSRPASPASSPQAGASSSRADRTSMTEPATSAAGTADWLSIGAS